MITNGQATPAALAAELESLRMARDWSYLRLGEDIAEVTNRRRAGDCWRKICMGLATPQQRTLSILKEYLAITVQPPRRRQARATIRRPAARKSA